MRVELSSDDMEEITYMAESSSVILWLKHRDKFKFNVGDILIMKESYLDGDEDVKWSIVTAHRNSGMPKRYVYVHEDEFGVGYIKYLRINDGELSDEIICLANLNPNHVRLELDPTFVDSVFLGDGSFDIKELQKIELKRRQDIQRLNRGAAKLIQTVSDANDFLRTLKVGDTFYFCDENDKFMGTQVTECCIKDVKERYIARLSSFIKDDFYHIIDDKTVCNTKKLFLLELDSYPSELNSFELIGELVYRNRPVCITDNI